MMIIFGLALVAAQAGTGGGGNGEKVSSVGSGECPIDLSTKELFNQVGKTKDEPPKFLVPVYKAAAHKFKLGAKGASILAGHHKQETNFGRSTLPGVQSGQNGSGAAGPMQFGNGTGAAGNAWATYGYDGNGDGKKDIYNNVDAIYGAAKYLKQLGAPGDWRGAIAGYYGADVDGYADSVLGYAEKYNLGDPEPCQS